MPIKEQTYKSIRDIFCDYLKIQKKEPLDEILYQKYIDLDITQNEISNEELEKKATLTDKFLNLFKNKNKLPTEEEKEEEKRNQMLQNLDKKILKLSESNGLSITPISQITKDTPLLDKNFDLIPNIRKIENNKENDINYFVGQGIGYTQGAGISYEVDFDTFQELLNKIFKNQNIEREKKSSDQIPDSDYLPEFINFSENNKKKKETLTETKSSVPEED
jgi:hypothetical protein